MPIFIFLLLHEHSALLTMRVCSHLTSSLKQYPNIPKTKEMNNQRETFQSVEEIPTSIAPPLEEETEQTAQKF